MKKSDLNKKNVILYKGELVVNHPLKSLLQELIIRGFSRSTVKNYIGHNQRFLNFINKSAREVNTQDIKDYLLYLKSKKYSNVSINNIISALNFYYTNILKRKLFFNIKRPKKEKYIPIILKKEEIIKIIESSDNLKHRLILSLLYGSGLRVSELCKIKKEDINLEEKSLFIKNSKGSKDRYTILSNYSIELLKEYLIGIEEKYLFNITKRSIQKIFNNNLKKSGINKKVSCHNFRHSFATLLLENKVSLRVIQKLLGHSDIKTTQRYIQISNSFINKINSPLD